MSKLTIKKALTVTALSLALGFQLSGSASAASLEQRWAASQAGMAYLAISQGADGDVGGWSDWAVVAAAASGMAQDELANGGVSAVDYLLANPLTAAALATDVERRVLAIVAAGHDPADFGGVNYVELLATYHVDGQIGDTSLLNDDIFGLLAIAATGDDSLLPMAQDALDYLLANQESDGGFGWATSAHAWYEGSESNDTAAALVALMAAAGMELTHADLEDAFVDAAVYLLGVQQEDGGFGYSMVYTASDGGSTSWALIALNAMGAEFEVEADAARDWILASQNEDGGFEGYAGSDVYTTTHAVIALLGTTWLLQPEAVEQPAPAPTPTPTSTPTPAPTPTPVVQTTSVTTDNQNTGDTAEVLSEQTPVEIIQTTAAPSEDKQDQKDTGEPAGSSDKKPDYTWLILAGLVLVAVVWFVIQSKSKKKS